MSAAEPRSDVEMLRLAMAIANRAVVADIETEAVRLRDRQPGRWYDTRPMLDPRELPPEFIDMNTEALTYAELVGAIRRDPAAPHLVCVLWRD